MKTRYLALPLAAMLLLGCSREGFEDSLNRRPVSPSESASSVFAQPEHPSSEAASIAVPVPQLPQTGMPFATEDMVINEDGLMFSVPVPADDSDAAGQIRARVSKLLTEFPAEFAMEKPNATLEIIGQVTCNDGELYSVLCDVKFDSDKEVWPDIFAFGLSFNAETGVQLPVESVMAPNTLAGQLVDPQTAVLERETDETVIATKTAYYETVSLSAMAEKVLAAAQQSTPGQLLSFSFCLSDGTLTAMFPIPHDKGDMLFLTIPYDGV